MAFGKVLWRDYTLANDSVPVVSDAVESQIADAVGIQQKSERSSGPYEWYDCIDAALTLTIGAGATVAVSVQQSEDGLHWQDCPIYSYETSAGAWVYSMSYSAAVNRVFGRIPSWARQTRMTIVNTGTDDAIISAELRFR